MCYWLPTVFDDAKMRHKMGMFGVKKVGIIVFRQKKIGTKPISFVPIVCGWSLYNKAVLACFCVKTSNWQLF